MDAPTARLVSAGQVTVALSSLTVNGPASVTLPLFVTQVAVADDVAYRSSYVPGVAVFTSVSAGA